MTDSEPPEAPESRGRAWLRRGLLSILVAVVFVVSLGLSFALHSNVSVSRHAAAHIGSWLLADTFYGKLVLDAPTRLSLDRLEVPLVTVLDETGERIIELRHVRIELSFWSNVERILSNEEKLTIAFAHARIEEAHVAVIVDEKSAEPTLVRALTPRPGPPRAPRDRKLRRELRVFFPELELGKVTAEARHLDDLSATLSNVHSQLLITEKGVALDIHELAANLKGILRSELSGTGSLKLRAPGKTQAEFAGFLGDVELQVGATIEGSHVELEARSPNVKPEAAKALLGGWPLREPVSATITANGDLPELETHGTLTTETSRVTLDGDLGFEPTLHGNWRVVIDGVNAESFHPQAPKARIDGVADVELSLGSSPSTDLRAAARGHIEPFTVDDVQVPKLGFNLVYTPGQLEGSLNVEEPNSPFTAKLQLNDEGNVNAKVTVPRFALENSRRIPRGPRGLLAFEADVHLEGKNLEVTTRGQLDHFRLSNLGKAALEARHIDFNGRVSAALEPELEPELSVRLTATSVAYGKIRYGRVKASVQGTPKQLHVDAALSDEDGRKLNARGTVLADGRMRHLTLSAEHKEVRIDAVVERLDPRIPEIEVSRLSFRGRDAELDGKVRYRPGLLEGELTAKNVNLSRASAAFGLPQGTLRGTLNVDSSFTIGKDVSRARINAELAKGTVNNWGELEARLQATLRDRELTGSITGADQVTSIVVGSTFEATLAGHALEAQSWTAATGSAEVAVSNIELAGLDWLIQSDNLSDVTGLLGLRARLHRDDGSRWPSAMVEIGAQNLQSKVKWQDETRALGPITTYLNALFDAQQDKIYGSASVGDLKGQLLTLSAAMSFDPDAWLHDATAARRHFQEQPISVVVHVPRRKLEHLPLLLPQDVPLGSVEGQFTLFGTPSAPKVSTLLDLHDLAPRDARTQPMSIRVSGEYAPDRGDVDAAVQGTLGGRSVALGKVKGKIPFTAIMGLARWNAVARFALDRFPLDVIPQLESAGIKGNVSGTLLASQEHAAKLSAHLDISELSAGRAVLGNGTLRLKGGPGEALMNFILADKSRSLNLRALVLGRDPEQLPMPHHIKSIGVSLDAKHINAAALAPLLNDAVARLHGNLDAELTWFVERIERNNKAEWEGKLEGHATLNDGGAYVEALGLELHDIHAVVDARPADRRTLIRLTELQAKARTTRVNFEASGQVYLDGIKVTAGDADLLLRSVPITLKGLSLGKASGQARCVFQRQEAWDVDGPHKGKEYILANVDLEHFNMKADRSASRELIELRPHPDVIVLQERTQRTQRRDLTPYRVVIHLKNDVRFGVGDISLPLQGEAQVDYDGESRVSGTLILVPGSRLPIFGKRFDVLSGKVQLDPENLGNPALDLALSGVTPQGDVINLTVAGTLREPMLEPGPAELQTLLGGGTATIIGGGVQALGLNELLGDSVGAVELRVDAGSEDEADPSYAAAVQVGPDLWFEGGYQRSQDSGLNSNQNDVFSGTVDYRFHPNWSLKTRLGNAGGGVDVLWQHRY